jgi:hypothetical protein
MDSQQQSKKIAGYYFMKNKNKRATQPAIMANKPDYLSDKKAFLYQNTNFPLPLILIVLMFFIVLTQSSCDNKGDQHCFLRTRF